MAFEKSPLLAGSYRAAVSGSKLPPAGTAITAPLFEVVGGQGFLDCVPVKDILMERESSLVCL